MAGEDDITCIHRQKYGECFVCMMAIAAREPICEECGDDLAAEGFTVCTDCLETHGDPHSDE